jgi:hypothetical protein
MSLSVDGFYAGPKHADKQTWLEGPEAAGFFRVTRWVIDAEAWRQRLGFKGGAQNTNSEVIAETYESAGAYVMGRRMADGGELPWGDDPPFRAPVFVVTNSPPPASSPPLTSPTSATPSTAGARWSSTTEDETRNPPWPKSQRRRAPRRRATPGWRG